MSTFSKAILVMGALALAGCYEAGRDPSVGDETGGTGSQTGSTSMTSEDSLSTSVTQSTSVGTTMPDESSTSAESSTGEPVDPNGFHFDDAPPEDYAQVDRIGMPAVNTALISSKDAYNVASPVDDDAGMFVEEILGNLTGLHAALDDDLMSAGLVPCDVGLCVAQGSPLILPDTLKISIGETPGFPNGRLPEDTVIDITLAVILLDLSAPGQDTTTLVGTNPMANDREFSDEFPYFAEPHE